MQCGGENKTEDDNLQPRVPALYSYHIYSSISPSSNRTLLSQLEILGYKSQLKLELASKQATTQLESVYLQITFYAPLLKLTKKSSREPTSAVNLNDQKLRQPTTTRLEQNFPPLAHQNYYF